MDKGNMMKIDIHVVQSQWQKELRVTGFLDMEGLTLSMKYYANSSTESLPTEMRS